MDETRRWWGDGPAPVFGRGQVPGGRERQRQRFAALAEYARRWPPEPGDGLGAFEFRVASQNGEDGVLAEILRRVGSGRRRFVEFGVETGDEGNCVALADHRGWSGWFFEADRKFFHALQAKYAWNEQVATIRERLTPSTIEAVFAAAGVPAELDVLSIDIDGDDLAVWQALTTVRARVVVIEYNSAIDPQRRVVAASTSGWDGSGNYGASLGALCAVARAKGYALVHLESSGSNAFFLDAALDWDGPTDEQVTRRTPNYFGLGAGHPGFDPTLSAFRELESPDVSTPGEPSSS